jgi:hypothetical protein
VPSIPLFLAGQTLPAGKLQQLMEEWTPYTPALTAASSNPTLGTGATQNGIWLAEGDLVTFHAFLQFGTAGTAAGSGTYSVSLPTPAVDASRTVTPLHGVAEINNTGTSYRRLLRLGTDTTVVMQSAGDGPTENVAHATPFAWGVSDFMILTGRYRAAA